MIILKSSDDHIFEVEETVIEQLKTLQYLIEDTGRPDDTGIRVPNVTGDILAKVIEYCNRHAVKNSLPSDLDLNQPSSSSSASASATTDDLKNFDKQYVKVDWETLVDIMLAANYLNIDSLLDLTCQAAADYIKDKNVDEIRTLFSIESDFTPEEEAQIRKDYYWSFE